MKKCVFFDRDGIVNRSPGPGYVERQEDFFLLREFAKALRVVTQKGYEAIIITNQRGVARGIMSAETLQDIHTNLENTLRDEHGLSILDIFTCTHNIEDECDCRKPKPGMILQAAEKHDIDLESSWMIGDNEKDVVAGKAAGCKTILVSSDSDATVADFRISEIGELESLIAKTL